jgi:histidinol-phosphate aminotransferase
LAGVDAYQPIPAVPFAPDVLKLDLNESPIPPSPKVREALVATAADPSLLNWYPDPTCAALRDAISRYVSLPANHILVTNGSNQAMEILARAYLVAGDVARIVSPTYGVFKQECQLAGAQVEELFFRDPFAPTQAELVSEYSGASVKRRSCETKEQPAAHEPSPRDAVLRKAAATPETHPKAIFLANPNNPTGTGWRRDDIMALLEHHPAALLVLDEAYAEFHDQPCVDLVTRFPNLVILRSFSKAFALAGIRCGYILAPPATLAPLRQVFPPWSVSTLTQIAAAAALADSDYMRALVAENAAARELIVAGLRQLGFAARNTFANFILWPVPDPAGITARLAARRVYVSNKDAVPQLKGYLRVTAGTRAQAGQFLNVVREVSA